MTAPVAFKQVEVPVGKVVVSVAEQDVASVLKFRLSGGALNVQPPVGTAPMSVTQETQQELDHQLEHQNH